MRGSINSSRRVSIQDLQYFLAKADAKIKKLRAAIGDYDTSEVENAKVLKTIYSLAKKLLRLPGEDQTKEFLASFQVQAQSTRLSARNNYDSSGSSGPETNPNADANNDYFPYPTQQRKSLPRVDMSHNSSPFKAGKFTDAGSEYS